MTEKTVDEATKHLERSYSWVYERLPLLDDEAFKKGGVIFITSRGMLVLEGMSDKAPIRGRPRKLKIGQSSETGANSK